ncbi:hypothetical protein AYO44_16265 [Planctomycetaceae bacterium SCGC AG-212-F19]|nr:hypothetical protein AYO44_16265 [Planctomycetaceae bacterium SCGC AG-212-F19]
MHHPSLASKPLAVGRPPEEDLLRRFDQAWQCGPPPQIEAFLPPLPAGAAGPAGPTRRMLLEELIKIDLECRWRAAPVGAGPRLEEYVARYPELGRVEHLPLDLITEEYRARQRWGDRPGHAAFRVRFAPQGAALLAELQRIDVERCAEHASLVRPVPPAPAGSAASRPIQTLRSVAELVETVGRCPLLSAACFDELVLDLRHRYTDAGTLAQQLVARGWLTTYQVGQLLHGRADDLFQGPYLLLDCLGAGATGWVFKARHLPLGRLVALKILRRELLADEEVLARFYREIQVVSQLAHPHVVHAYDAGPLGRLHVLSMEYVEGLDLHRLVQQAGPLPVDQAREFVRQAALGLQHIHENRLVHRDFKPANLLRASGGLIKILDLGLARLGNAATGGAFRESWSGRLTPVRSVMMGTPDYLAPEQALDFHSADIRADIYSLGCTLYFLLVGRPPFAGGTLAQKLLRHQQAQPPDLRTLRPEVPAELGAVIYRMLAKAPSQRYQTPAEVVEALTATARQRGPSTHLSHTLAPAVAFTGILPPLGGLRRKRPTAAKRPWLWAITGGSALLLCGLGCLLFLLVFDAHLNARPASQRSAPQHGPLTGEAVVDGDIVGDASFETPAVGSNAFDAFRYGPSGSPWKFSGGAGVAGNGSGFTSGNPPAPQGGQVAFLQGAGSRISQTIPCTGGTYTIRFLAAQRNNYSHGGQTLVVLVDNKSVGTFTPLHTAYVEFVTDRFTVPAGPHVLTFEGLNPLGNDNTAFIDVVKLDRVTRNWQPQR